MSKTGYLVNVVNLFLFQRAWNSLPNTGLWLIISRDRTDMDQFVYTSLRKEFGNVD